MQLCSTGHMKTSIWNFWTIKMLMDKLKMMKQVNEYIVSIQGQLIKVCLVKTESDFIVSSVETALGR